MKNEWGQQPAQSLDQRVARLLARVKRVVARSLSAPVRPARGHGAWAPDSVW